MTSPQRVRLEERRDQALADLRDLDRQVESGEIGQEVAARLQRRYEAEAADAIAALDALATAPVEATVGRSKARVAVGVGGFVVIAVVVTFGLVNAVQPRPEGGFVTGGVASDVTGGGVDLATVTNEEMEVIVGENPDVIPMRLALARRYVEEGDFSAALPHYMYILERDTNAEALMYVGWMTYLSGDAETGVALLERSLQVAPDEPLAEWFLANALLYGLGDGEGAVPLLQSLIDSGILPDDVVATAEAMLDEARSA